MTAPRACRKPSAGTGSRIGVRGTKAVRLDTRIVLPVTAQTTGDHLSEMHLTPFDPAQPAPENNGLNSHYDYVGAISDYQTGNELWCRWHGQRLACAPRS